MRKLLFILLSLFFTLQGLSQSFKTSVFVSPNISWVSFSSEKIKHDKMGFGFSAAIREEFYFSKLFSIGSELEYLSIEASFQSPDNQPTNGFVIHYTRNVIKEQILEIPLLFKIKTSNENKSFYFFGGVGVNYIFSKKREVNIIRYDRHIPDDKELIFVTKGNFDFNNKSSFGNFFLLGMGKSFVIRERNMFVELRYRKDLTNWIYPTANDPVDSEFNIRNNSITLNLGFNF